MKRLLLFSIVCLFTVAVMSQTISKVNILQLDSLIKHTNQPLVVNFWATWCAPCLEELPYIQKITAENNVLLVLVNLDTEANYLSKLKDFIKSRQIKAVHLWLNETNADYFCPVIDESWSGAIPASLFINNKKNFRFFYEEKIPEARFREVIEKLK